MNWEALGLALLVWVMGWMTGVMHERYVGHRDLWRFVGPGLIASGIIVAVIAWDT